MKLLRIVLVFFAGSLLMRCEDLVEEFPTDRIVLETFFSKSSDAEVALIGAYNYTFRSDVSTNFIFYPVRSSDNMTAPLDGQESDPWMWRPNMDIANGNVSGLYSASYQALANINLVIERVASMDSILFVIEEFPEVDRKRQIVAEARFLRAWMYYNMVQFWGDVPLILEPPTSVDPNDYRVPRTPKETVMDSVMADLVFCEQNCPENYDYQFTGVDGPESTAALPVQKGRATSWAAKMLMARIHMQRQEWNEAIMKSREVINSGEYTFTPRYADIFEADVTGSQNSSESILEIQSLAGAGEFNNTGGYSWFTVDGLPRRGATLEAYDLFQGDPDNPADVRKLISMAQQDANPNQIYATKYANSFPWWNPENGDTFNFVIFRLTEAYLNIAEALNEQGYPSTESLQIINRIRARAQDLQFNPPAPGIDAVDFGQFQDQEAWRQFVREERRRELIFEGQRWYDMIRYDQMDGTTLAPTAVGLTDVSGNYDLEQTRVLLPIPEQAIIQNNNLEQNPGYQ